MGRSCSGGTTKCSDYCAIYFQALFNFYPIDDMTVQGKKETLPDFTRYNTDQDVINSLKDKLYVSIPAYNLYELNNYLFNYGTGSVGSLGLLSDPFYLNYFSAGYSSSSYSYCLYIANKFLRWNSNPNLEYISVLKDILYYIDETNNDAIICLLLRNSGGQAATTGSTYSIQAKRGGNAFLIDKTLDIQIDNKINIVKDTRYPFFAKGYFYENYNPEFKGYYYSYKRATINPYPYNDQSPEHKDFYGSVVGFYLPSINFVDSNYLLPFCNYKKITVDDNKCLLGNSINIIDETSNYESNKSCKDEIFSSSRFKVENKCNHKIDFAYTLEIDSSEDNNISYTYDITWPKTFSYTFSFELQDWRMKDLPFDVKQEANNILSLLNTKFSISNINNQKYYNARIFRSQTKQYRRNIDKQNQYNFRIVNQFPNIFGTADLPSLIDKFPVVLTFYNDSNEWEEVTLFDTFTRPTRVWQAKDSVLQNPGFGFHPYIFEKPILSIENTTTNSFSSFSTSNYFSLSETNIDYNPTNFRKNPTGKNLLATYSGNINLQPNLILQVYSQQTDQQYNIYFYFKGLLIEFEN